MAINDDCCKYLEAEPVAEIFICRRSLIELLKITEENLQKICEMAWSNPAKEKFSSFDLLVLWQIASCLDISVLPILDVLDVISYLKKGDNGLTFSYLQMNATTEIALDIQRKNSEVGRVHSWVKENIESIVPNSKLVPVKARDRKRPDFLLEVNGFTYPVECKLEAIKPSINQLHGYMKLWNVEAGYLVARRVCTEIPDNIIFIECP